MLDQWNKIRNIVNGEYQVNNGVAEASILITTLKRQILACLKAMAVRDMISKVHILTAMDQMVYLKNKNKVLIWCSKKIAHFSGTLLNHLTVCYSIRNQMRISPIKDLNQMQVWVHFLNNLQIIKGQQIMETRDIEENL